MLRGPASNLVAVIVPSVISEQELYDPISSEKILMEILIVNRLD